MAFLFMFREVIIVIEMIADAKTDEIGFDVVSGEGECGEQVVVEIVTDGELLVESEEKAAFVGNVFVNEMEIVDASACVEHEADAVEHHFV